MDKNYKIHELHQSCALGNLNPILILEKYRNLPSIVFTCLGRYDELSFCQKLKNVNLCLLLTCSFQRLICRRLILSVFIKKYVLHLSVYIEYALRVLCGNS